MVGTDTAVIDAPARSAALDACSVDVVTDASVFLDLEAECLRRTSLSPSLLQ